jgi:hypothetical protein
MVNRKEAYLEKIQSCPSQGVGAKVQAWAEEGCTQCFGEALVHYRGYQNHGVDHPSVVQEESLQPLSLIQRSFEGDAP